MKNLRKPIIISLSVILCAGILWGAYMYKIQQDNI